MRMFRRGAFAQAALMVPAAAAAFDPAALFAGGEEGGWYDPSDLSTLWQDSAGTTPSAVDSPVGKLDDKSGNGNHLTQATASACPILRSDGSLFWLEFDGVDDYLWCVGAELYNAGAATIVGAVRGEGQVQNTLFGEFSSSSGTPFYNIITTADTTGGLYLWLRSDAATSILNSSGGHVQPAFLNNTNKIFTFDDDGSTARMRTDRGAWGVQAYARAPTTLNKTALGAMSRVFADNFTSMRYFGHVGIGRKLADAETISVENWLAARQGRAL